MDSRSEFSLTATQTIVSGILGDPLKFVRRSDNRGWFFYKKSARNLRALAVGALKNYFAGCLRIPVYSQTQSSDSPYTIHDFEIVTYSTESDILWEFFFIGVEDPESPVHEAYIYQHFPAFR